MQGGGVEHLRAMFDAVSLREKLGVKCGDVMLLSVGELSVRKNHAAVIKALAESVNQKFVYCIAGVGALQEKLSRLAVICGVGSRVKFLGFRTDIKALCHAADIFVFPSLQEGLPVALMEAMSSGLPCVASRIRGNTDLLGRSKFADDILCSPKSAGDFSGALERIVSDRILPAFLGRENERIMGGFEIRSVGQTMRGIYRRMGN